MGAVLFKFSPPQTEDKAGQTQTQIQPQTNASQTNSVDDVEYKWCTVHPLGTCDEDCVLIRYFGKDLQDGIGHCREIMFGVKEHLVRSRC